MQRQQGVSEQVPSLQAILVADARRSECSSWQRLLDPGGSDVRWDVKPTLSTIRKTAIQGCCRCQIVWDGVTAAFPAVTTWDNPVVYGLVPSSPSKHILRVGVINHDHSYVGGSGWPREWIDFYEETEGDSKPTCHRVIGSPSILQLPAHRPCSVGWVSTIAGWILKRDSSHSSCALPADISLPTRVIGISLDDETHDVALRQGSKVDPRPYIALSYCWGASEPLCTDAANISEHMNRIKWEALPRLFQDVIEIARLLQVPYLWIDSLCIIQGDFDDWTAESAKMVAYYGNAWLTITADAAAGAKDTCMPRSYGQTARITHGSHPEAVMVRKLPYHFPMQGIRFSHSQPPSLPLFHRSWAYQERLLSRRMLHLGPEEVVWECCTKLWCECGNPPDIWNGRPENDIRPFRADHHAIITEGTHLTSHWNTLLELYLIRNLTFEADKLKSIIGLARQLGAVQEARKHPNQASQTLGDYTFGIWSATLPAALLWEKHSPGQSRNPEVPSWSWASITGAWTYQRPPEPDRFVSTVILVRVPKERWDFQPQPNEADRQVRLFGHIMPAELILRASGHPEGSTEWAFRNADFDPDMLISVDLSPPDASDGRPTSTPCICLQLGATERFARRRVWSLILEESLIYDGCYERVGVVSTSDAWYDEKSAQGEVTIV